MVVGLLYTVVTSAQSRINKAVFMIVDGIPADVIEKVNTPALDEIAKTGAFIKAYVGGEKGGYSQTPTISAVGYNSLLTGTWVNKHNVWDNDIKDPNYQYWNIFRLLKMQQPQKKAAVFSTWKENRTLLVGERLPQAGNIQLDHHLDGLELDTVRYPHDKNSYYIHLIDEVITDSAAASIRKDAPDLTWVYLQYTDDMGHRHGDSRSFYEAVEMMDKQVDRVWKAVQYRQQHFNESWQIFITTDHGRDSATGQHHGGQSKRERATWIVTNATNLNEHSRRQPGIIDIMPTIAAHLGIAIPREQLLEMDGLSLTGKLSAVGLQSSLSNGNLRLNWKAMEKTGKLKIWLTTTNQFKTGSTDEYRLIGTVPVAKESFESNLKTLAGSGFYKIVLEAPHNFLNTWITNKKK